MLLTVKELKKIIKNLPNDCEILTVDVCTNQVHPVEVYAIKTASNKKRLILPCGLWGNTRERIEQLIKEKLD